MKTELNNELKERFFALYWDQEVQIFPGYEHFEAFKVNRGVKGMDSDSLLLLRHISALTNEEAVEVAKMYRPESKWLHDATYAKSFMVDFGASKNYFDAAARTADYLRSIGVALPFMGHSVEELIDAGWIKLTDSQPPSPL